jgi:methyl-accepting chemotaxis protein
MAAPLRPPGADGGPSRPAAAASDQPCDQVRQALDGLAESLVVLQAQLGSVNETTSDAASGIIEQTTSIRGQLEDLIGLLEREAARLLAASVEEGVRIAEEEEAVRMLRRYLDRSAQGAQEGEARARRIEEAVSLAAPVLTELRDLAMQSRILSINASVEAARQRGAFSVIADEVRRVSERSATAVAQVEAAIHRVANVVKSQFSEETVQAQRLDAVDRDKLQHFAQVVARRAEGQRAAEAQRQRLLADVARQHDQLSAQVVQLLAMTQFQDVSRQHIEGVQAALANAEAVVRGASSALAPGADAGAPLATLDASEMLGTYVMHAQRQVHAEATGQEQDARSLPTIELF